MEIFIWHKHLNKYSTTKLSFSDASNNRQVLYSNLLKEFQLKKSIPVTVFYFNDHTKINLEICTMKSTHWKILVLSQGT